MWLRALLNDLKFSQQTPTVIQEDNQGAISLSKNPRLHGRMKHVDIRYNYISEKVEEKKIVLEYCPTKDMVADILTKALSKNSFEKFRTMISMSNRVYSKKRKLMD